MKKSGFKPRKKSIQRKTRLKPGGPIARTKGMSKKTSKPKYATKERDAERNAWAAEHDFCWLCAAMGKATSCGPLATHEAVERSKSSQPYELHNFARLGSVCHHKVQGRGHNYRCLVWALKSMFDPDNYDLRAGMAMLGRRDVDDTRATVELMAWTMEALLEGPKL